MSADKFRATQAALSAGQIAARARMKDGEGFIYVAAVGAEIVKVGFSLDPARRVQDLVRYYEGRHEVRLLGHFPASITAERAFHARHAHLQIPPGTNWVPGREHYPRSIFTTPTPAPQTSEAA